MQDIEILKALDGVIRNNYNGELEERGHSISNANVILKYLDEEMEVSFKLSKKQALRTYFNLAKNKGMFNGVGYDKFEELYNDGVKFEDIEEKAKEGQLPFDGEKE